MRTIPIPPVLICALFWPWSGFAPAQGYPAKPVRLLVGFPPGGPVDTVARIFAPKLHEGLAQPVLIDNRPGAAAIIAADLVAKAPPDGYTLGVITASVLTVHPHLYPKLPFQPMRDFAPISILATAPLVLAVHPSLPARSIKELVALAKARPGALNYASSGGGGAPHLAGELFKSMARVDIAHIPYKGIPPALTDVVSGQVSILFSNTVSVLPHVQAGKLRALGVTTSKRALAAPNVPTIAEAGLPGFETSTWQALMAPTGTPAAVLARLHAEAARAAKQEDVKERLMRDGSEAVGNAPGELAELIKSETLRWGRLVKEAGIRVE